MALIQMDFESQYLACRHQISVILPDVPRPAVPKEFYATQKKFRVLWLLHGTFGDHTDWVRRTNIETYALEHNLVVVMPSALNSSYVDWKGFGMGFNMYAYFFEELMPMIQNWFPVSSRREDNFIAGLSMGGRGSMIYALNRPELFAAAGALSRSLSDEKNPLPPVLSENLRTPAHLRGYRPADRHAQEVANAGGHEAYLNSVSNTWDILVRAKENGVDLPKLYFTMGTSDGGYEEFCSFRKFCQDMHYDDIVFEEEPGYAHEWRFWDLAIERFIQLYISNDQRDKSRSSDV